MTHLSPSLSLLATCWSSSSEETIQDKSFIADQNLQAPSDVSVRCKDSCPVRLFKDLVSRLHISGYTSGSRSLVQGNHVEDLLWKPCLRQSHLRTKACCMACAAVRRFCQGIWWQQRADLGIFKNRRPFKCHETGIRPSYFLYAMRAPKAIQLTSNTPYSVHIGASN